MNNIVLLIAALVITASGCIIPVEIRPGDSIQEPGFCGTSTFGSCSSDYGCVRDGCSNQVCRSAGEEPVITTCEYRECYSAGKFRVECKCVNSQCQWK